MPRNRDLEALLDIEQAAKKIIQFNQGLNREAFLADEKPSTSYDRGFFVCQWC
ncbi:MAG: hypothetical protein ICV55_14410 [Coleofasciculus sp. C3-bin4]|nr:hypothetical protein [Coleofasciculus sp. C3-bin4]